MMGQYRQTWITYALLTVLILCARAKLISKGMARQRVAPGLVASAALLQASNAMHACTLHQPSGSRPRAAPVRQHVQEAHAVTPRTHRTAPHDRHMLAAGAPCPGGTLTCLESVATAMYGPSVRYNFAACRCHCALAERASAVDAHAFTPAWALLTLLALDATRYLLL